MKDIQRVGPYLDIVEARDPLNKALVVKVGLRGDSFQQSVQNGLKTVVAQYFGIVQDGLLDAMHCFEGLKRNLMHGDNTEVGGSVLVYSWRPEKDWIWSGSRFDGKPVAVNPPPKRVLVALVRREEQPNEYSGVGSVFGSIERWNWVKEDPLLPHAPVNWEIRYGTKLWSRSV